MPDPDDAAISAAERDAHLAECPVCRTAQRHQRALVARLRRVEARCAVPAPATLRLRVAAIAGLLRPPVR